VEYIFLPASWTWHHRLHDVYMHILGNFTQAQRPESNSVGFYASGTSLIKARKGTVYTKPPTLPGEGIPAASTAVAGNPLVSTDKAPPCSQPERELGKLGWAA
jgi:DnaJ-class molecular chaperone